MNSKQLAIKKAEFYTDSIKMAAVAIRDVSDPFALTSGDFCKGPDINLLHDAIKNQITEALEGGTGSSEIMLMVQAKTLDVLFNNLISKSLEAKNYESVRYHMDVALRAQNQCRKTLLALAAIKHPIQKQIVEQQNIAINQQVNNRTLNPIALKPKCQKVKPENELISEVKHETLDVGGTFKTGTINQKAKTVVMVNRRKNTSGQS